MTTSDLSPDPGTPASAPFEGLIPLALLPAGLAYASLLCPIPLVWGFLAACALWQWRAGLGIQLWTLATGAGLLVSSTLPVSEQANAALTVGGTYLCAAAVKRQS